MDESPPIARTYIARLDWQIECCETHPGVIFNVGANEDPAELQARYGSRIVNCDLEAVDSTPGYGDGSPNPIDRVFNVLDVPWPCADDEGEVVILGDILEHFPQAEIVKILREARRVAPELCVTVPEDVRQDESYQVSIWRRDAYNRHTTVVTRPMLEDLCTKAGWEITRLWTAPQGYDDIQGYAIIAERDDAHMDRAGSENLGDLIDA